MLFDPHSVLFFVLLLSFSYFLNLVIIITVAPWIIGLPEHPTMFLTIYVASLPAKRCVCVICFLFYCYNKQTSSILYFVIHLSHAHFIN